MRFDPRTRKFELITGGQQFGHSFDDWGQRYVCSNSNHIQQVIWSADALDRLGGVSAPNAIESIAVEGAAAPVYRKSPAEPWRIVRTRRRANDPELKKRLPSTELVATGFFTSATGVTIYRGDAYPPEFRGNAFVGDVGSNLIHRKTIQQTGIVASAKRADENVEFVTSTDTWFRPANFINGPDGCLYVTDMYRETIEHPFSVPEDIKAKLDLESGTDRGRIYRLTPPGGAKTDWVRPGEASTEQLVELLKSTNGWHRETAQRLLLQKRDPAAVSFLRELSRDRNAPLAQTLAVRILSLLGDENSCGIHLLLNSTESQARRVAVQLGTEMLINHPNYAAVRNALFRHSEDPSPLVRFELALSLGKLEGPGLAECWETLAAAPDFDAHLRAALLGAAKDRAALVHGMASREASQSSPLLVELLRLSGAMGGDSEVSVVFQECLTQESVSDATRRSWLIALGTGLRSRGRTLLSELEKIPEQKVSFARVFEFAVQGAQDNSPLSIEFLAFGPAGPSAIILEKFLTPQNPIERQRLAINVLGDLPDPQAALLVLAKWKVLSPELRRDTIEILLRDRTRVDALLQAITDQHVKTSEISTEQWQSLLGHPDLPVRERAANLRGKVSADREAVIAAVRETVEAGGDFERGRVVFKKTCAVCHKLGDDGHAVGPDLVSVANKSPADLLVAILDPNREAQPKYVGYTLETTQGQVFTGILASESTTSVTLRRSEAKEDTIARELIESLASSGISLMPVGVEKDLTPQNLADVIAFIRGQGGEVKP